MKTALLTALLLAASAAVAQTTPAPQPDAKPAPARPVLKLRLDELEPEPARPAPPREPAKRGDEASSLPGLGGRPHDAWIQRKTDPIPPNTAGDSPLHPVK